MHTEGYLLRVANWLEESAKRIEEGQSDGDSEPVGSEGGNVQGNTAQ